MRFFAAGCLSKVKISPSGGLTLWMVTATATASYMALSYAPEIIRE